MDRIRIMNAQDRSPVHAILSKIGLFTAAEIEVAMELVDIFLSRPDQKDYIIYVAENDSAHICGYICYGPTPVTEGTYDLYWIAVDPDFQSQGIGTELVNFLEQQIRHSHGRLIIIETSAQKKYESTQKFYAHHNYQLAARIKDFYKPGDDRLIYTKYI